MVNPFTPVQPSILPQRRFTPGKIIIHFPQELASFWGTSVTSQITDLFSGQESNLLTINCVSPSDYTPISEGEGVKIQDGLRVPYATAPRRRLGFRFKVRDRRTDLRIAIEELMEHSVGSSCEEITPIVIEDYCFLKTREDRTRGYRLRTGVFGDSLEGLQGAIVRGKIATCQSPFNDLILTEEGSRDRYESGFGFRFMELEKTNYY